MFETVRYVPVLKCKRGEKKALEQLAVEVKASILPFLEIVEMKEGTHLRDHIKTSFHSLDLALPPGFEFFLDPMEVSRVHPEAAASIFNTAARADLTFIPVTGINRTSEEKAAAMRFGVPRGVCLRIGRKELEQGRVSAGLSAFAKEGGADLSRSDLFLDMGPIENLVVPGVVAMARAFISSVPEIRAWRRVILSGSAFPRSMGILGPNEYDHVARTEWVAWRDEILGGALQGDRVPTFSDCGIQHPLGVEGFDPRLMAVSAVVRYAEGDSWLLVKGRSTRKVRPGLQFPRLARLLSSGGRLESHYAGPSHCHGCNDIEACAQGQPHLGSAEVWRRIGTVHHITTVVEQLAEIPSL